MAVGEKYARQFKELHRDNYVLIAFNISQKGKTIDARFRWQPETNIARWEFRRGLDATTFSARNESWNAEHLVAKQEYISADGKRLVAALWHELQKPAAK